MEKGGLKRQREGAALLGKLLATYSPPVAGTEQVCSGMLDCPNSSQRRQHGDTSEVTSRATTPARDYN